MLRAGQVILIFLAVLGCTRVDEPSAPPVEPSRSAPLVSVRSGINDDYFGPDGLTHAFETLESERREVAVHRQAIVAALELGEGMEVADLGAGTGLFLAPLSAAVGPSGRVHAVDIVPAFVQHLRDRVQAEGLTNVEVVAATATDPELARESVDLIFVCDVYHHIEYPSVVLPALHRALRPDGRLVVIDFHRIPGQTSEGLMQHVRADQATFTREIEAQGFVLEREIGPADGLALEQNYMLVFRRRPG